MLGIFTYIWLFSMLSVGKIYHTWDAMGNIYIYVCLCVYLYIGQTIQQGDFPPNCGGFDIEI